ncbi:glutaredoxin domain-containing protein [Maribellus sediminis]|uniref:glutaredoxin domain-containing protein n=1 Tax=Maribellus sediminis TaxID=2696285 RepID=UPI00143053BB|nr:glutaredoxin domain-containing protein [Maribellus sediminis]
MKGINSINELKEVFKTNSTVWLLLYKNGSEQSDCAFANYQKVTAENSDVSLFYGNVAEVRDIHPEYGISSVPTLLKFEQGTVRKIIKGCHQAEQFKAMISENAFVSASKDENKPQKNVVVYTTPTCSWCTTVKRHLDANEVRYREINVAADAKAAEAMVKKSGQQGVPQTEINGQIVVGFDKTRINSLLGIN